MIVAAQRRRRAAVGFAAGTLRLPSLLFRELAQELEPSREIGPNEYVNSPIYIGSLTIEDLGDGT